MKQLAKVLTVDSGRELIKYKSFLLLIFVLLAADRAIHRWIPQTRPQLDTAAMGTFTDRAADYVFMHLPGVWLHWMTDVRALAVVLLLFVLKQAISLWPSSDMRRMHRQERERFGLLAALKALGWDQVVWDAMAVAFICGGMGIWCLAAFGTTWIGWHQIPHPVWLAVLSILIFLAAPLAMAGFSFSSKLAVISRGEFKEKLALFAKIFTDRHLLWRCWLFFLARIVVEALFVAVIPVGAILFIDHFWLRMPLAALSATPVYAYLKMATFKFFLYAYGRFELVRQEYPDYFQ